MVPAVPSRRRLTRRNVVTAAGAVLLAAAVRPARAAASLDFDELYGKIGVLGLEFSAKAKALAGQSVVMKGFMAPPLKAESNFFVLTEIPMALCPFCSSDADWPDNIVVVYLDAKRTFTQTNAVIAVTGQLEIGSWTDPDTGFVSLLRLRNASLSAA